MKKIIPYLVVILLGISNTYLYAQESRFKALYLTRFTNYMDWEKEKLTIGVMGNSPVIIELEALVSKDANLELKKISDSEAINLCDMIYLPTAQSRNFDLIQEKIGSLPIVVVADDESLIQEGAEMAFYLDDSRLRFAVSKSALNEAGVKMSQSLLVKAKVVE